MMNNLPTRPDSVLLVDANPDMRSFIHQGISREYLVIEASNGREALAKLSEHTPTVIISDLEMPVMNGIEFASHVKSSKVLGHIPFLFLTTVTDHNIIIRALQTGANDYIIKPFAFEILLTKLRNIKKNRCVLEDYLLRELSLRPKNVETVSSDEAFLAKAMVVVEENMMETDFNVEAMVSELGVSRSALYNKFKTLTNLSTGEFIRSIRLKRAYQLLEASDMRINEIMFVSGFNTASYFSKCFKLQYGVLPSQVRKAATVRA